MGALDGSRSTDRVVVLSLVGEHDAYESDHLARALAGVLAEDDERPIIIDLASATFIDSTLVFVISRASKEAESRGRTLVVHVPPSAGEYVHRLVAMASLESFLPIVYAWESALVRVGATSAA